MTRPKKGAASTNKVSKKAPLTGWPLFKKTLYKKLFGWLDPKFKMNGKKLVADSRIVWRFMVSSIAVSWVFCLDESVVAAGPTGPKNLLGMVSFGSPA